MKNTIKVIGFDADDTLWVNEPFFRDTEQEFCKLFDGKLSQRDVMDKLFTIEISNLTKYGYGSKSFMLSMIETALQIFGDEINHSHIQKIMDIGNSLLSYPRELIEGVKDTLDYLSAKFKLILVTKGDLLEQENKLEQSGLVKYFHHIEILSEKNTYNYNVLLKHLDIKPEEFLMVGNSLKSDIEPVLKLGGYGAYVPFHITWQHEQMDVTDVINDKFMEIDKISELKEVFV